MQRYGFWLIWLSFLVKRRTNFFWCVQIWQHNDFFFAIRCLQTLYLLIAPQPSSIFPWDHLLCLLKFFWVIGTGFVTTVRSLREQIISVQQNSCLNSPVSFFSCPLGPVYGEKISGKILEWSYRHLIWFETNPVHVFFLIQLDKYFFAGAKKESVSISIFFFQSSVLQIFVKHL